MLILFCKQRKVHEKFRLTKIWHIAYMARFMKLIKFKEGHIKKLTKNFIYC